MIALFFASRIIDELTTYDRVPTLIKDDVDRLLTEKGFKHLIEGVDSE